MSAYIPAPINVLDLNNASGTVPNYFSFATIYNIGGASGTVDFGGGNILTLIAGSSLTLPYQGRPYGTFDINAIGTHIQCIWVP